MFAPCPVPAPPPAATPLALLASFGELVPEEFGPLSVLTVLGGLALLLGGMEAMGRGLRRLSGGRVRQLLGQLGRRPLLGVLVGAVSTAAIHSSGATTAILISLVEAGMMDLRATIPVIMGANIGTTFTGQLLAFRVTWLIPVMLAGGLAMRALARRDSWRSIGQATWGMGLLFLGLGIMSAALGPLRDVPAVVGALRDLESVPVGLLAGLVLTVLFQSSTATTGILIGLGSQHLVTIRGAIPFLLGANIGSCSTGLLASIGTRPAARRVAVVHVLFNVIGVLLFAWWIPWFADLVEWITPGEGNLPREIANAHTLFNVIGTALLLPFSGLLARAAERLVPEREPERPRIHLDRSLLRRPISSPDVALAEARHAIGILADEVLALAEEAIQPGRETGPGSWDEIRRRVREIHELRRDLVAYLNDIGEENLRHQEIDLALELNLVVAELDTVATLAEDALELDREQAAVGPFSPEGERELVEYRERTLDLLRLAVRAWLEEDVEAARVARRTKKELGRLEARLRRSHVLRMHRGIEASERTDALHLAWLELMRQVNTHAGRIARILLDRALRGTPLPPGAEPADDTGPDHLGPEIDAGNGGT